MSYLSLRSALAVGAWVLLIPPAFAVDRSNVFPVSEQQRRALGIELLAVQKLPNAGGARFPAQVILPPQQQQVVSAPVAGLVNQVLVEENQAISAGTPLLVLSSPEFGELQLALVQAVNRTRLAIQTTHRERALFKEGIIPLRRLQEAQAAESDSNAVLAHAKAALALAGMSNAAVQRLVTTGEVQPQLTINAPAAGTVIGLAVKPGQRVANADALLHMAQLDQLWLDIQIPSAQATRWPKGSKLNVMGGAQAEVLSVSPLTSSAQTVMLRARVSSGIASLHPGEFVQVELPGTAVDAWDVPLSALIRDGEQAYVFVHAPGKFVATPVTVLASAGQRAKVSGALRAGQLIAVSSVIMLKAAWQGVGGRGEE
ncbi:MAG: efflux RND transporter periplasmic adaptor subunit [Gammaproteobacteria bacterium]